MSLVSNSHYQELCKEMNPYLAIMQISDDTRKICDSLDNRITVASALNYAAQGKVPNPKDYPDHRLDRVKEYLTYVDDVELKAAVIASYEQSLAKNNLVYEYKTIEDTARQSRVRVIMNLLWDSRPHKAV